MTRIRKKGRPPKIRTTKAKLEMEHRRFLKTATAYAELERTMGDHPWTFGLLFILRMEMRDTAREIIKLKQNLIIAK